MFANSIHQYCNMCAFREAQERKARRQKLDRLIDAVGYGKVEQVVRILNEDPTLLDYKGFAFDNPCKKTNTILDYAKRLGRKTIVQILQGFSNFAEREE